ncbi:MAG: caspase family protein [Planctomycetia bacterium]|nr:caspase family protein [Planctomycetia bacterium]
MIAMSRFGILIPLVAFAVALPPVQAQEAPAGTKHALILCGHPGDKDHRKTFAETVEKTHKALVERYKFLPAHIRVQFGAPVAEGDGPVLAGPRGGATREEIEAAVAELRQALQPEDTLWVIVMGHSHYDGKHSHFNIPGPDLHEQEFGKLFAGLACREQVFFIGIPTSGFYIKPLSANGRVIISATEADLEVNETLFAAALADVLANPPGPAELDADRDGNLTLFDLYIALTRNIVGRYLDEELLPTEHALLDDNGDGRGTELQIDYLTEKQGGRAKEGRLPPPRKENADGALAARILLPLAPAGPTE